MMGAYYLWGHWRNAHMLSGPAKEPVATPAEVAGQPPTPVCSLGGNEATAIKAPSA
jgi:hypothetical protein